jgi:hypothetical protein
MENTDVKKPWETLEEPSQSLRAFAKKPLKGAGLAFAENPTEENFNAMVAERDAELNLN